MILACRGVVINISHITHNVHYIFIARKFVNIIQQRLLYLGCNTTHWQEYIWPLLCLLRAKCGLCTKVSPCNQLSDKTMRAYCIAGTIGGELYLANWRISCHTTNIKSTNIAPTVQTPREGVAIVPVPPNLYAIFFRFLAICFRQYNGMYILLHTLKSNRD